MLHATFRISPNSWFGLTGQIEFRQTIPCIPPFAVLFQRCPGRMPILLGISSSRPQDEWRVLSAMHEACRPTGLLTRNGFIRLRSMKAAPRPSLESKRGNQKDAA
jgi:hypothetical protein